VVVGTGRLHFWAWGLFLARLVVGMFASRDGWKMNQSSLEYQCQCYRVCNQSQMAVGISLCAREET